MDIFRLDTNGIFYLLSCYESVQEVAKDLACKIKTLQGSMEIIKDFHNIENLHSLTLTHHLNNKIIKCLPDELSPYFNEQFMDFRGLDPNNVRAPATFQFLSRYMYKLERNYSANPALFDVNFCP